MPGVDRARARGSHPELAGRGRPPARRGHRTRCNWDRIRAAFDALLSDSSQLTGSVPEFGGIPKQELAGFLIGDLLIHSWDLARSVGADEALPPDAVEATTIGLHHVPPELLRGTNPLGQKMMAAAVEVPADASPQDRMLAFTGRRP